MDTIPQFDAPHTATRRINVMSAVALGASITGFISIIGFIAGIVLGHIALSQLKYRKESGRGLAIAALAISYSVLGLAILLVLLVIGINIAFP